MTVARVLVLVASWSAPSWGSDAVRLPADPTLDALVAESLAARPSLEVAAASADAARARVDPARTWADPSLEVGLQNDGFDGIMVGRMETSWLFVMASETLPKPGVRGLRGEIAELSVEVSEAALDRERLTTEAEVRRAWLEVVLARDRRALLERIRVLWNGAGQAARALYETGGGAQTDLLRAQVELNRLRQREVALDAEERVAIAALNALRAGRPDEPIETARGLRDLPLPELAGEDALVTDALERSPELRAARAAERSAARGTALARKDTSPELRASAGIMSRGGEFPPMWQVGLGGTLPVFARSKQGRAVEEALATARASEAGTRAVELQVRLAAVERAAAFRSAAETVRLYREALLIQSAAVADGALARYRSGKAGFAVILDAWAGLAADEEGYLVALADLHRTAIAAREVAPGGAPMGASAPMGRTRIPVGEAAAVPAAGGANDGETPAAGGSSSMNGM